MSEKSRYHQCILQRENSYEYADSSKSVEYDTSWLPEAFCVVGNNVGLKNNGVFEYGWKVVSVSEVSLSHEQVQEMSKYYRTHRKGTDI